MVSVLIEHNITLGFRFRFRIAGVREVLLEVAILLWVLCWKCEVPSSGINALKREDIERLVW
jgi:hypothetical protein